MTREQILARLEQEYARRREDNLRLFEQRREEACGRCPGLRELLDKRHAEVMAGVRSSLTAPRRDPGANAGLPARMAEWNRQIREKLVQGGLAPDFFAARLHLRRLP